MQFCGLIMGDHSRCAINTSFNTGTVIGFMTNIYGYDPSGFVPSFAWGREGHYKKDKILEVIEKAMERKGELLTDNQKRIIKALYKIECESS